MDKYLDPYQLSQAGNPVLSEDEVTLQNESNLSLYFGDNKKYRKWRCVLTTARILIADKKERHAIHLKHIKSTQTKAGIGFSSPKIVFHLKDREVVDMRQVHEQSNQNRNNNNNNNPQQNQQQWSNLQQPTMRKIAAPHPGYMMLSFHNGSGNRDTFLSKLNKALQSKSWVKKVVVKRKTNTKKIGIAAIREEQKERQMHAKTMVNEAFADIESLMIHAKTMVALANKLSSTINRSDDADSARDASEFDSMLHNMGIASPVTKEAAGSQFHELLARQLVDFLLKPLSKAGGILTLTDVYCLYNRARGTQLVSPDDLLLACRLMSALRMPMKLHKFPETGVLVVQLAEYNAENTHKTILNLILQHGAINELRLSQLINISVNLSRQQLLSAEKNGHLCRDDSINGLTFYGNVFLKYASRYSSENGNQNRNANKALFNMNAVHNSNAAGNTSSSANTHNSNTSASASANSKYGQNRKQVVMNL